MSKFSAFLLLILVASLVWSPSQSRLASATAQDSSSTQDAASESGDQDAGDQDAGNQDAGEAAEADSEDEHDHQHGDDHSDHGDSEATENGEPEVASFFSVAGMCTLLMLIVLQIVLGFDNLLYISIESKRVPKDKQSFVRKLGISLAIVFRIGLLFVVTSLVEALEEPFKALTIQDGWITAAISGHSLIVLGGGAFILWTAIKEIYHLLAADDLDTDSDKKPGSVGKAVSLIVLMNLIFSFDSILSAMALTKNFWIMATAIVFSGILMIFLADKVADFLHKNRMYEVLGLFVLFIVGIMLVSEGGHLAHINLFGHPVEQMNKSTFYFVLAVMLVVDVVQSQYQKKLLAKREARLGKATAA